MASPGNPNQSSPPPFDMNKFFNLAANPPNTTTMAGSQPFHGTYPPPTQPPHPSSYPPPALNLSPFFHHQHQHPPLPPPPPPESISNLLTQRSLPYPTSSPPPFSLLPTPNPNAGARLMALLTSPPPQQPSSGPASSEIPHMSGPVRLPSSKVPRGRHLVGEHVVYDVDVRLPGEAQPQLEVTPITKYASDPQLVLGRQIAANRSYVCYGLKQGNIRVLNINTASRSLLRGHTQGITDMAFFAEDVHLLASASTDGRVCVWKVSEGPEEDSKLQITGNTVIAIQITGEGESVHPQVCWHCHKQEVLVVGIGKLVLRIDTTKVGKGEFFSAEQPLKCPVDNLIEGVQMVGKHDGEVTDLSMCQWMTSRLVSASMDGTIKIWEDRKTLPLVVLRPHDGHPVNSAAFVTSPHRPDHIMLITAGPLNREVKLWASSSEEGWLLPSDAESWKCTQTLDIISSATLHVEDAFFNKVLVLTQAGLLLLANAKKNAIYALHLEYGPNPAATHMDYLAEFTVTMPILSFTGISDISPFGEHIIQVYCVQTQAIQQYVLDLLLCLPPPLEKAGLQKSDSSLSCDATNVEGSVVVDACGVEPTEMQSATSALQVTEKASWSDSSSTPSHPLNPASGEMMLKQTVTSLDTESQSISMVPPVRDNGIVAPPPPLPLSPRLSQKLSGFTCSPGRCDSGLSLNNQSGDDNYAVNRHKDAVLAHVSDVPSSNESSRSDENRVSQDYLPSPTVAFKPPTHLITPSEILRAVSSSEMGKIAGSWSEGEANALEIEVSSEAGKDVDEEVKIVADIGSNQDNEEVRTRDFSAQNRERIFSSQISGLGMDLARECHAITLESVEEARLNTNGKLTEPFVQSPSVATEEIDDSSKYVCGMVPEPGTDATVSQTQASNMKDTKHKGRASGPSSPSPSVSNSTDSSNDVAVCSSLPFSEAALPHFLATQEKLNQLISLQKEMKKQMTTAVNVAMTKESRRLEAALGRSLEKNVKANSEALWAHIQEESFKKEKLVQDRTQQLTTLINNFMNKDLPSILEKVVKREMATIQAAVLRVITPAIEKTISSTITEAFQKGVGDKSVNQLEKSVNLKLEATVARQIQAQFQISGRQAIQDSMKSCLESSVVPAFEMSCRAMFDQVDATFQKGIVEHTSAAQQHFESGHSSLALALRDAINSASSMTQTLSGDLADAQQKLLALAVAGANSSVNPLVPQISSGPLGVLQEKVGLPFDPTKELSRLIFECKYEEAFTSALQRSDVSIVSWLCSQVDLQRILTIVPLPLSQGVLLSLLQQLACDIDKDTPQKLSWMTDVAGAINRSDPVIAAHVGPIFKLVRQILNHQCTLPTVTSAELSSIRLLMLALDAMLMTTDAVL